MTYFLSYYDRLAKQTVTRIFNDKGQAVSAAQFYRDSMSYCTDVKLTGSNKIGYILEQGAKWIAEATEHPEHFPGGTLGKRREIVANAVNAAMVNAN